MRKIKVLNLIKSLGRGGAEMLLPETLKLHNRDQFDFYYAYFLDYKHQVVPDLERHDVEVHCFNANTNPAILLKVNEVKRYVRQMEIDLIHCHLPWAGYVGRLIHKLTGIPVVYTEHNNVNRYHPITRMLNNFTFSWQNYGIAVSKDSYESIMENTRPAIPVKPLLNAVNTEDFRRSHYDRNTLLKQLDLPDKKIVVSVAVFRPQKRLDRWAEVVKQVSQQSDDFFFVLVGEGSERGMLEDQIKRLGIGNSVLLTGLLTDPKPYYAVADFFLMTSDYEGLPVSLLEAMSMGCVPVSTSVGGIPEVLRDGNNGLLVDLSEGSAAKLAAKITDATDQEVNNLSKEARSTVVDSFSMERMVKELEKIYRKVYEERPADQAVKA